MPSLVMFRMSDGTVPLLEWLEGLTEDTRDACVVRLEWLAALGHSMRRPHSAHLGSGVHELRVKHRGVNYRILYFFFGRETIVLSHGIRKQYAVVPPDEIMRVLARKARFELAPDRHTYWRSR